MYNNLVLQWYWQERLIYPYEKTKAFYYGPREKWMFLVKPQKRRLNGKVKRNMEQSKAYI